MDSSLVVLVAIVAGVVFLVGLTVLIRHFLRQQRHKKQARNLQFLLVKIPHSGAAKQSDIGADDNIQTMKQNLEVMNQVYKNFTSLLDDDWKSRWLGNDYVVMELLVENELIKRSLGVPSTHVSNLEQMIGSFYPGAVIDHIEQPALLHAGKYLDGGFFQLKRESAHPLKTYEAFEADPMDSVLSACSRLHVDEKLVMQYYITPVSHRR
jgi:hypothetical protein